VYAATRFGSLAYADAARNTCLDKVLFSIF
jgi:hypothetical protein